MFETKIMGSEQKLHDFVIICVKRGVLCLHPLQPPAPVYGLNGLYLPRK